MGAHRAKLSRRLSDADAMHIFAEHHIVQVRRRKNGEIVLVKHAAWGWISPTLYYAMQKFETAVPKVLEGGYRVKAAIYATEFDVDILGSGVHIPLWIPFVAAAFVESAADYANGHIPEALIDLLALGLPFGEVWTILRAVQLEIGFIPWLDEKIRSVIPPSVPVSPVPPGGPSVTPR